MNWKVAFAPKTRLMFRVQTMHHYTYSKLSKQTLDGNTKYSKLSKQTLDRTFAVQSVQFQAGGVGWCCTSVLPQ